METEKIIEQIKSEYNREDMNLHDIEFNRRGQVVMMNYVYHQDVVVKDVHKAPRQKDPVEMDQSTMRTIIKDLEELGIEYHVRNDDFI